MSVSLSQTQSLLRKKNPPCAFTAGHGEGPPPSQRRRRRERVFALLKNLFGEQQMLALADYVQASLMLNYNGRRVG